MIGILPAAGQATRIHGLPKYLLPIGDGYLLQQHVDRMLKANATRVFVGSKPETRKMLETYTPHFDADKLTETWVGSVKSYETMTDTVLSIYKMILGWGTSITQTDILFGMPDVFFDGANPYPLLAKRLQTCDVAIAVFRARPGQHTHGGMVSFSHNRVTEVIDKPAETNLQYIWGALAWKPAFWECLTPDMPHVGYGLPVAIERGLDVRAVICEGGFWDCGTPDEYFECIRSLTGERV